MVAIDLMVVKCYDDDGDGDSFVCRGQYELRRARETKSRTHVGQTANNCAPELDFI